MHRHAAPAVLLALALLALCPAAAAAQAGSEAGVRYRTPETVYLDAGTLAGIDVGDRLAVVRGGETIGEVEVIFAAERSASCRVLSERTPIQAGDRVRLPGGGAVARPRERAPDPRPGGAAPERPESGYGGPPRRSSTGLAGTVSFEWESRTGGDEGRDADRSGLRLNLRARDIAGLPLQARLRLRTLDVDRERRFSNGAPASESRDRLYEAALIYDPPEGRFAVRAGRLGTNPFVGLGYLDGILAELRPLDSVAVGGFYGLRPELEELGFDSSGSKLGAFLSFTPSGRESPGGLELLLAGVREEGEIGVSRDYVTVETRYDGGGRWSFYEHAELDLNRDWREARADESVQLSNVAVTALARLSERNRLSLSYERFQRYWTEETRFVPEELFDDFLRQGFRASWQSGRPEALSWSVTAGFRNRESAPEDRVLSIFDSKETTSLGLGVNHPRVPGLGISLGAQALGFTSSSADGVLVSVRGARRLGRGHEIGLTLGSSLNRTTAFEEERVLSWGRASLWLELPYDLFGRADVELLTGDDVEGQRWSVGLGYRL